MDQSSEMMFPK